MDYFRYQLRKGSKKERCPECERKTFVPYVDRETNKEAGEQFGRCERINSCGYVSYPKSSEPYEKPQPKPYEPPKPIDYVDKSIVEKTFENFQQNVFFMYLLRTFGKEKAFELQMKYNIGTAKHGGTIFWQQDDKGRFRTAKVMYYSENGKRDKSRASWFVHKKIRDDFNYQQCFFGLHLVGANPVALCESEKTAILMSVYEPDYTWIASGGSEMLNMQRITELSRLDKVYPDNGQFEKWEQKTKFFAGRQIDVSVDLAVNRGELEAGSDILDLIQLQHGHSKQG